MKKSFAISIILATLLVSATAAFPAGLFAGYAGMKWGTDLHKVMNKYRNGNLGKLGDQVIYKQVKPNREMSQRTFGFKESGLNAVSVTFNAAYVKKTGIENLLAKHKKSYGEGVMDRSAAPHMITYVWEDGNSRITFAYSPRRPEMTVLMYQQK
ncbi:MAG: hypothetical protein FD174_1959 [Geobacteraceae bacterium]|nr:MAG: hypothetical protein FD174_1959 [Geobacteraceae bacterium]